MEEVPGSVTPARRPSERLALVEYVYATESLQEPDWLEWKSAYDLTKSSGRVATAKQILGFANRMPDVAARHASGYAYLLIGVEPASYHGMPVHDSADIENWLRPYVGDAVLYDPSYVSVDGKAVLFITVDPPQWGDDIHTLRKEGVDEDGAKTIPRGTIFVRKGGKTERASDADVDRLTDRARRQGVRLKLSVEAERALAALPANILDDGFRDAYLDSRKRALLAPLRTRAGVLTPVSENRTQDSFRAQVDSFAEKARAAWTDLAIVKAVEDIEPKMAFALTNPTDENYESVLVELTIPIPRWLVFKSVKEARRYLEPSAEPPAWGKGSQGSLSAAVARAVQPRAPLTVGPRLELESVGDKATLVRFPPVHVRPRTRHPLGEVVIAALPAFAGEDPVTWRATSTSTRGDVTGEARLLVQLTPNADPT